jgi:peptidoglycan/xylan/chitin deacetylase (PgdA/CDA1 family)
MRKLLFILLTLVFFQAKSQTNQPVFDIPVFAYHRFGDNRFPSTNISTDVFEAQLKFLKENNYNVLTFGDAIALWQSGEPLPAKATILTIDDGYLSFYTHGWPLLKKYGFPATIFIQTETIGGSDYMTRQQILEIRDAGIEIGNHSASHDHFVNYTGDEAAGVFRRDLQISTAFYKDLLGYAPEIYAYPYGEWLPEMEQVLAEEGYKAAAAQQSGVFSEVSNPFAIPRFPMGGPFATINGFTSKVVMKSLRVETVLPSNPFFDENPPQLTIEVLNGTINPAQAQLFVGGKKVEQLLTARQQNKIIITAKADFPLKNRRTLYTITAPSADGRSWHWFSHLWINPQISE